MAVALLRYANRQKVADALTEQGYEVHRVTVNRWARGAEIPEIAARMIAALFGHEDMTKTPRPLWAEGLDRKIEALAGGLNVNLSEQMDLLRDAEREAADRPQRPERDGATGVPRRPGRSG